MRIIIIALFAVTAALGAELSGLQIVTNGPFGSPVKGLEFPVVAPASTTTPNRAGDSQKDLVQCANLVYGGSKSSVCFSEKFLETVEKETTVIADRKFTPVKLTSKELFHYPFAIMTGEGTFSLPEAERKNLKAYLTRGGFLLASAGCSSTEWNQSFRREIKQVLPEYELKKIPMTHALFRTVFDIKSIALAHGGSTQLEGIELDGKIVVIYSSEGLNDTGNVKGCCCCGGNEVKNCQEINVNVFSYALIH